MEAKRRGIKLSVVGERLHFSGPHGQMSDQLRTQLGAFRDEVIRALRGPRYRSHGPFRRAPFLPHYCGLLEKFATGELGVNFTNSTHWAARFIGSLDVVALIKAFRNLVGRHAILRARAQLHDGESWFVASEDIRVHFEDEAHGPSEERAIRVQERVDSLTWRAFDLRSESLFRPFVVKVAPHTHVIGFVLHHLIADAVSVSILVREIFSEYAAVRTGSYVTSQEHALQYSDYLIEMNEWLVSPGLRLRLNYWMTQLQGARDSCLPADFPASAFAYGTVQTETLQVQDQLMHSVTGFASSMGTTPFITLLAVYSCVLRHLLGTTDLVVLVMHNGRDDPALRNMVGSFQNQLPLRIRCADVSFCDLVTTVRDICSDAYEQMIPYGNILYEFAQSGAPHVFPEFNFLDRRMAGGEPTRGAGGGRLETQSVTAPVVRMMAAHHAFHALEIVISQSAMTLKCRYLDVWYRKETIENLLTLIGRTTRSAVRSPQTSISALCAIDLGSSPE